MLRCSALTGGPPITGLPAPALQPCVVFVSVSTVYCQQAGDHNPVCRIMREPAKSLSYFNNVLEFVILCFCRPYNVVHTMHMDLSTSFVNIGSLKRDLCTVKQNNVCFVSTPSQDMTSTQVCCMGLRSRVRHTCCLPRTWLCLSA